MVVGKARRRSTSISVVGLGYVGLPAAIALHNLGFKVHGIDLSEQVVNNILKGVNPIADSAFSPDIPIDSLSWSVSKGFEEIQASDVAIITVPTPTSDDLTPDFSYVESAFRSVLSNIDPERGTIVVLESTVSPGTTRRIGNTFVMKLNFQNKV